MFHEGSAQGSYNTGAGHQSGADGHALCCHHAVNYCYGAVGTHIVPACGGQFHVPFHSRFPYGKDKEYGGRDGTWQTYTLRQQGSRLEIRIPGGFSQPITGGAGDVETVTGVEGNPLFTVYTGGLVEISAFLGKSDGKDRQVLHTAVYPYAEYFNKGDVWEGEGAQ